MNISKAEYEELKALAKANKTNKDECELLTNRIIEAMDDLSDARKQRDQKVLENTVLARRIEQLERTNAYLLRKLAMARGWINGQLGVDFDFDGDPDAHITHIAEQKVNI